MTDTITVTGHKLRGLTHITYTDYPVVIARNADGTYRVTSSSWTMTATHISVRPTDLPDPEAFADLSVDNPATGQAHGTYIDRADAEALARFLGS